MTNRNCTVFALALLALALTETQTGAQSTYTPYAFTNLAGMPGGPGNVDGTASAARFFRPNGVAVDSAGNVYVADTGNSTIRKITPAGAVTTLAGTAGQSGNVDGTGSAARFNNPLGVAVDSTGNVYVADTDNHTIRQITPAGVATTLAGTAGESGSADGTGSHAQFFHPSGVAVDGAGNVYVADESNYTIRKITPGREVTTLAGSAGEIGSDDGTGSAARFGGLLHNPFAIGLNGVAADSTGNVYVADTLNHTIRKITPDGEVTTLAGGAGEQGSDDGNGSAARFNAPWGVAVDNAHNVYVADTWNSTIRKITPAGAVTTLAGSAGQSGRTDGTASAARFYNPRGVAVDSAGGVYVADSVSLRKITPIGAVTTLAGSVEHGGSDDGTGSAARFSSPERLAVDGAGNIYVADSDNETIRKITPAGAVTTLAGSAAQTGSDDGTGSAARFLGPSGVAVDNSGNIYVADDGDSTIRKITPAGAVTTLAGSAGQKGSHDGNGSAARFNSPWGVAVDRAGNIYVGDSGNSTIRKITPTGDATTLAGRAGSSGSADGNGSAAQFRLPEGVAVDSEGNVYVADYNNFTIRKITPAGVVTTLAGSAGQYGSRDGTGSAARFNYPSGVAVDSAGNVYVADSENHTIRKITPAGVVTTPAGSAGQIGGADGVGTAAQFWSPRDVAVDGAGNLYVADRSNNRITKGTPLYFQFETSAVSLTLSDGTFQVRLTGPSASNVIVERSADLKAWTPVQTNALPSVGLDLSIRLGADQAQFFRARLAP